MSSYRYKGEPAQRVFGALPEGDYQFVVVAADESYIKPASGNDVLPLELTILPEGVRVFANPWSGTDKNGKERDGIGEFLLAVNRVPQKGEEPNWKALVGARGKCRLKIEVANQGDLAGKEVNKVAFFYRPKQLGQQPLSPNRESFTESEIQKSQQAIANVIGKSPGDENSEPDDIPF